MKSQCRDERRVPQRGGGGLAGVAGGAFGITVAGMGLRFLSQVFFARWLGVYEFGRVVYALNWAQVLSPGATLGYSTSVLAFMPTYEVKGDWASYRGIVRRSRQVTISVGLLMSLVALVVLSRQGGRYDLTLVLAFLLVPFMGLLVLNQGMFRAVHRIWIGYSTTMILQPLLAIVGAGALLLLTEDLSAVDVLSTSAGSVLLVVAVQGWILHTSFPPPSFSARPNYRDRTWTGTSFILFLSAMFLRVVNAADIILVGMFLGPASAGLYGAASRLADLGSLVHAAVGSVVAPTIAEAYAREDFKGLQSVVTAAVRLAFWPSLLAVSGMIVLSQPLLMIFGEAFTEARWVLILLALGNLVNAATGPGTYLLGLTGSERHLATVVGINAALNLVLGLTLIPLLGMNGAAVASTLTMMSYNVLVAAAAKRRLDIRSYLVLWPKK